MQIREAVANGRRGGTRRGLRVLIVKVLKVTHMRTVGCGALPYLGGGSHWQHTTCVKTRVLSFVSTRGQVQVQVQEWYRRVAQHN